MGGFGEYQTNIKWFDTGYSDLIQILVFEGALGEDQMNIKWFDTEYSNLIIFANQAKF